MKRALSIISVAISIATAIYTLWYMHYANPFKNEGALSTIGLSHKPLFIIWGIMTLLSLGLGITLAYIKNSKSRLYMPLLIISAIGMALTLLFDFKYDVKPDYYLHCIGSLAFSVFMGMNIFLLFLLNYKKGKMYAFFTYVSATVLLADFILLLIFKETGFIEAFPIIMGYIMLGITNLRSEKIESKI